MGDIYRAYLAVARAGGGVFLSMSIAAALQGNPVVTSAELGLTRQQGKLNENKKKMAKVGGIPLKGWPCSGRYHVTV